MFGPARACSLGGEGQRESWVSPGAEESGGRTVSVRAGCGEGARSPVGARGDRGGGHVVRALKAEWG